MCTYAQTYKHLHAAAVPGPEGLDGSHVGISVARKHRPELVEGIQTELVDEAWCYQGDIGGLREEYVSVREEYVSVWEEYVSVREEYVSRSHSSMLVGLI
jgi:hypothetical protein